MSGAGDRRAFAGRLWRGEAGAFTRDPGAVGAVRRRLGWLAAPEGTLAELDEVRAFAAGAVREGFREAVLLGMGGSSLCPLVLSRIFAARPDGLGVRVVDTTSPGTVSAMLASLDPARTLFVVSSKSGTTVEPLSLYRLFRAEMSRSLPSPGGHFAAITDPGTPLAAMAAAEGFRGVFAAPADVGGRYSALTVFGMVPAALMGLDVPGLLASAGRMARACGPEVPWELNPGVALGAWMSDQAASGRDKLNLLASPSLEPFALWLEQLLAESTGKEGRGIIPVAGAGAGEPEEHGPDAAFVTMTLEGEEVPGFDQARWESSGFPVFPVRLGSTVELGGEFFRWEVATAAAGSFLGVNPFDEPNVTESKKNTEAILARYAERGSFPEPMPPGVDAGRFIVYPDRAADGIPRGAEALPLLLGRFLGRRGPSPYLAILAYLPYGDGTERLLRGLGETIRAKFGLTTTVGFGPRYLHSTGQIHKGGPSTGLFLYLTCPERPRLPVPGSPYTIGELHMAQALGDEQALRKRGRPVMRIHLMDDGKGLEELARLLAR